MYPYRTPAPAPSAAPSVVYIPEPLTRPEAYDILVAAAAEKAKALEPADLLDDIATALRKTWDSTPGLVRIPVSDPVWVDMARAVVDRMHATTRVVVSPGSTMDRPDVRVLPLTGPQAGWQ